MVTFNLDEYHGLAPDRLQSYHRWMFEHFFDHVNIPRDSIHIPDGQVPADQVSDHCRRYEAGDPAKPAASTSSCWGSAATGTSVSTSRFRRG